jgi:hypothetical protein
MSVPLFRHAVATLAYRGGKAIRDAPPSFATYRAGSNSRTPVEILAHVNDLLDWMDGFLTGVHKWHVSAPGAWTDEVTRFHSALVRVDQRLEAPLIADLSLERLFQGPVADALTHVGQLTLLRRLAGAPVRGENYYLADIESGRVGPDQSPARKEFD